MKVIWKNTLELMDLQTVQLPHDAEILCAREQREKICIWFICTPNAPTSPRWIRILGTGHENNEFEARYLGTAMLKGGELILHVFEEGGD